jgi:hypothetical protein
LDEHNLWRLVLAVVVPFLVGYRGVRLWLQRRRSVVAAVPRRL